MAVKTRVREPEVRRLGMFPDEVDPIEKTLSEDTPPYLPGRER